MYLSNATVSSFEITNHHKTSGLKLEFLGPQGVSAYLRRHPLFVAGFLRRIVTMDDCVLLSSKASFTTVDAECLLTDITELSSR